jgi:putative SOS response-associated peptidase YedK
MPVFSMPVLLDEAGAEDWMNAREKDPLSLKRLLVPAPDYVLTAEPALRLSNSDKKRGQMPLFKE